MKQVVAVIILLLILLSYTVNASETQVGQDNATTNIKFEAITSEADRLTIKISTGEFEGVEENSVMSASMTLVYDEANIIQVEGQESNDWRITISNETKRVLIETDNANSNTEIAQITFYFNQEVTEGTTGNISIQEINVSDGNLYDETYPEFTQSYTINPPQEEAQEDPEENNQPTQNEQEELPEINTNTGGISQEEYKSPNQSGSISNQDNTVAPDRIPQTGISMGIVIGIIAIIIIAVVCFIKYRSIEIK